MADLFSVISDQGVMDQTQIALYQQGVILAAQESTNFFMNSPLIDQNLVQDGATASFFKFSALSGGATLTDGVEVTSEAVTDSKVTLTLVEHGNVVTTTELGNISTGGRLNAAVPILIGKNMGQYVDKYFIQKLEAGSNEYIVTQATEAELLAANVITPTYLEKAYTFLRANNIPKIIAGKYVAIMHPHVISDLRDATGAGSWQDVNKYSGAEPILMNEVASFKGFKIIESANVTVNADAGASAVDSYHSCFFGANALGAAWSSSSKPRMTMVTGTDKLDRFIHIGWKGTFAGGLVDTNASCIVTSASAFGANT